jgi:hypothetical protein
MFIKIKKHSSAIFLSLAVVTVVTGIVGYILKIGHLLEFLTAIGTTLMAVFTAMMIYEPKRMDDEQHFRSTLVKMFSTLREYHKGFDIYIHISGDLLLDIANKVIMNRNNIAITEIINGIESTSLAVTDFLNKTKVPGALSGRMISVEARMNSIRTGLVRDLRLFTSNPNEAVILPAYLSSDTVTNRIQESIVGLILYQIQLIKYMLVEIKDQNFSELLKCYNDDNLLYDGSLWSNSVYRNWGQRFIDNIQILGSSHYYYVGTVFPEPESDKYVNCKIETILKSVSCYKEENLKPILGGEYRNI